MWFVWAETSRSTTPFLKLLCISQCKLEWTEHLRFQLSEDRVYEPKGCSNASSSDQLSQNRYLCVIYMYTHTHILRPTCRMLFTASCKRQECKRVPRVRCLHSSVYVHDVPFRSCECVSVWVFVCVFGVGVKGHCVGGQQGVVWGKLWDVVLKQNERRKKKRSSNRCPNI